MADRFMIEEEQRRRVRASALNMEARLVGDPDGHEELAEVRRILERVGREDTEEEASAIKKHANWIAKRDSA